MASYADVCEKCFDNFIVSSKFIKCFFCDNKYHTNCASLKDHWLKILTENPNIFWTCDPCKEKQTSSRTISGNNDVLSAENILLRKLIEEKDSKNTILQENIQLLKEKIIIMDEKSRNSLNNTQQKTVPITNVNSRNAPHMPSFASAVEKGKQSTSHNIMKTSTSAIPKNPIQPTSINKQYDFQSDQFEFENVSRASSHTENNERNFKNQNNTDWIKVKPKRRRNFVVGQCNEAGTIQTVPKLVSLHVTRLHPSTKTSDLVGILKNKFPDVSCEVHASKYPDKYTSMKVTIRQEHLKEAWKREIWPSGAIVSRFFGKKRVLTQQVDPQNH